MKNIIETSVSVLLILGALNWGSVGLFDFNILNKLFRRYPRIEKIIYILIGFAGLYTLL